MNTRRVESFLLRIVVSDQATDDPEQWRGRIQHIATGAEQQIGQLDEAIAFISTHLQTLTNFQVLAEPLPPPEKY
jgi:hypothetical protein